MAKAQYMTKEGVKITLEGSPKEIAELLGHLEVSSKESKAKLKKIEKEKPTSKTQKNTPINLISSLIDGGFFKKPKDLGAVKQALEELGHFYPVTTLSPILLRLIRKRQLRRIKDKKRWLYTFAP